MSSSGSHLRPLALGDFSRRLRVASPVRLSEAACAAMHTHYEELVTWNQRLSLVGPGTFDEAVERHFAESLYGLRWLGRERALHVVDVGAGGGFPGLPLAAVEAGHRFTLVESRQRKWAFLRSVARRAALPCDCLNARVDRSLPEAFPRGFDVVLARAIRLDAAVWRALFESASEDAFALVWAGAENPELPESLRVVDEVRLPRSDERRIVKICNNQARRGVGA